MEPNPGRPLRDQIEAWVIAELGKRTAGARLTVNTALAGELSLDSLEVVEFLIAVEDAWGVVVSDEEAVRLRTIGDVAGFIAAARSPGP